MSNIHIPYIAPTAYAQAKHFLVELYTSEGSRSWEYRMNYLFQNIPAINSLEEAELIMVKLGKKE